MQGMGEGGCTHHVPCPSPLLSERVDDLLYSCMVFDGGLARPSVRDGLSSWVWSHYCVMTLCHNPHVCIAHEREKVVAYEYCVPVFNTAI